MPPFVVVSHRSLHHAEHSGYKILARHLPAEVIDGAPHAFPPWRLRRMLRRPAQVLYSSESVAKEYAALRRMMRARSGVVHFLNAEHDFYYTAFLSRVAGWRSVGTFHYPPASLREMLPDHRHWRHMDVALCVATSQIDEVRALVGHDRVVFVPHGVDTTYFAPVARSVSSPTDVLFVGQHMRDFHVLEQALVGLRARFRDLRATAVVRADWQDRLPKLSWLDVRSGISDEQLREQYRTSTLLLMPLTDSTANCAMLEAMACGRPMVVTDVGGVRDYATPDCAVLTEAGSADAMVDGASRLLQDASLVARMGAAARARSLSFDWVTVANEVVRIYRNELGMAALPNVHPSVA